MPELQNPKPSRWRGWLFAAAVAAILSPLLYSHSTPPSQPESKAMTSLRYAVPPLFFPHRTAFTCVHEADVVPPITPEAEQLFRQARTLESADLFTEDIDYQKVIQLLQEAAKLGHWKARLNLIQLRLEGKGQAYGLARSLEAALKELEAAMADGIPAAWDMMGSFYLKGIGVPQDASAAYAFFQRAAEMGDPRPMVFLAEKMKVKEETPDNPGRYANIPIATQMFQCAFDQGYGQAAYYLALLANREKTPEAKIKALNYYQAGIKMGDHDCAVALAANFGGTYLHDDDNLAIYGVDKEREKRYWAIARALDHYGPELKLPNLDKVLPLPQAKLPRWDGQRSSLIDAAKAVVPNPKPPQPQALAPAPDALRTPAYLSILHPGDRWGANRAPKQGLWLPEPNFDTSSNVHRGVNQNLAVYWLQFAQPQYFVAGALMKLGVDQLDKDTELLEHVRWAYLGDPRKTAAADERMRELLSTNWRVQSRQAVAPTETIAKAPTCKAGHACPETGTWAARVNSDHPAANSFNRWDQQAYVRAGEPMPTPIGVSEIAGVEAADVIYTLIQRDQQPHFIGDPTDPLDKEREETRQRMLKAYEEAQRKEAEGGDAQA